MDRQGLFSKFRNKHLLLLLAIFVPVLMISGANQSKNTDVKGEQVAVTVVPTLQPTAIPTNTPTPEPTSTPIPTKKPVIYVAPTAVIQSIQPTAAQTSGLDNNDYYTNVDGNKIQSPANSIDGSVPAGATAICRDGTYSFSQHRRGTCSHHGGVASWL